MSLSGHEFELRRVTGCVGKEAFPSPRLANRAIKRMLRSRRKKMAPGERIDWYRCPCCQAFHIGGGLR